LIHLKQEVLFPTDLRPQKVAGDSSSTFVNNMTLPVHRWFRYSAGFSAVWVEEIFSTINQNGCVRVLDPFAGSATTLLASENVGVESWGIDSHPFICRVAKAKLLWRTDPDAYMKKIDKIKQIAQSLVSSIEEYPKLIRECYTDESLSKLDLLRKAFEAVKDETPASELSWLTLVSILRKVSKAGTAPWQYVLPKKQKSTTINPFNAFNNACKMIYQDMLLGNYCSGPHARFIQGDARTCDYIPSDYFTFVITSPPYPNNYDYADATRLEMTFMREINGWGDLQKTVRDFLMRSCTQQVPEKSIEIDSILSENNLLPIRSELSNVCHELADIRKTRGGKKTYHNMVACYFSDLAKVWIALRRVCTSPSKICFVIGDSAPYGVYVPVVPWLGELAIVAGFKSYHFEKIRDRNIKWKNRKHRVPLQEGHLWVEG
jgi:hypothetical protein